MAMDLRMLLAELEMRLTETIIRDILRQMLLSLEYCHEKKIMHRDVKLENFLVDLKVDGSIHVKLADFGIASRFEPGQKLNVNCGSLMSVAPEMLKYQPYCQKIDSWALGVILYELLSGYLPFHAKNDNDYKKNIVY